MSSLNKRSPIPIVLVIIILTIYLNSFDYRNFHEFNGQKAFEYIKYQTARGPRTIGSVAHQTVSEWIISRLEENHWIVDTQTGDISGVPIRNIIAKRGKGSPWIIIASHYDSRLYADRDPKKERTKLPVEGANDGASSVAILLELARVIPKMGDKKIWLVFFDAEDNGGIPGYDWIMGSRYFVSELEGYPDRVVILDMVGDSDLNIYMELNSNPELNNEIWKVASDLGFTQFIPKYKYDLIDDHIPFIMAGIKTVNVIDFDYPYWHTTHDTVDKVSADSLSIVGKTISRWLELYPHK